MSEFADSTDTGAKGQAIVTRWLEEVYNCQCRPLISERDQRTRGDLEVHTPTGNRLFIEVKTEEKHTGKLFLEQWSNRKRLRLAWMFTLTECDWLFYYFLDVDFLYAMPMWGSNGLLEWAFYAHSSRTNSYSGRFFDFPCVAQSKCVQKNDTWGRLVPIDVLEDELCSFRLYHPRAQYGGQ